MSMLRVGGFILLTHHNISSTLFGTIFSSNLNFALLLAFHPVKPPFHSFVLCKACNTILFAQREPHAESFLSKERGRISQSHLAVRFSWKGTDGCLGRKNFEAKCCNGYSIYVQDWYNMLGQFMRLLYFCQPTEIEFAETKLYTHTNYIWKWNKWIKITASIWIFKTPKKATCLLPLNPHEPLSLLVTKGGEFLKAMIKIPSLNQ